AAAGRTQENKGFVLVGRCGCHGFACGEFTVELRIAGYRSPKTPLQSMLFSPFLATRYLKPKRTFVSIITVISILGVALGVWAMIVVIAVFTGYGERIKESILGFEPHLVIRPGEILKDWVGPYEKIKAMEGIESVTPFVEGPVVMEFQGLRTAPVIRGMLPPEGKELERLRKKIARQPDPADPDNPAKTIPRGDFFGENDFYSAVI